MKHRMLWNAVLVVLVVTGCSRSESTSGSPASTAPSPPTVTIVDPSPTFIVPTVRRDPPTFFRKAEVDLQPYADKTQPGKVELWFKHVEGQGWTIDWDAERKPFDLIVIHHSDTGSNVRAASISDAYKNREYARRYRSGNNDPYVKDLPIHSGHVVNGQETFIPYHHLVYPDGRLTTELQPLTKIGETWYVDMAGWHCGDWDANCRSVAICLAGTFTDAEPPAEQVDAVLELIAHYRTFNAKADVKPHHALSATICPGKAWDTIRKKLDQ